MIKYVVAWLTMCLIIYAIAIFLMVWKNSGEDDEDGFGGC